MSIGLAYGIHVPNGSHQYLEALLMPFICRNRSKCPCLLAAITLKCANSHARLPAGSQKHRRRSAGKFTANPK